MTDPEPDLRTLVAQLNQGVPVPAGPDPPKARAWTRCWPRPPTRRLRTCSWWRGRLRRSASTAGWCPGAGRPWDDEAIRALLLPLLSTRQQQGI